MNKLLVYRSCKRVSQYYRRFLNLKRGIKALLTKKQKKDFPSLFVCFLFCLLSYRWGEKGRKNG